MNTEKVIQRLWHIILWYLFTWVAWFGTLIVLEYGIFQEIQWFKPVAMVFFGFALVAWTVLLFLLIKQGNNSGKNPKLKEALNDDFMVFAKQTAANWGFWSCITFAAAMIIAGSFTFFSGKIVAMMIVLVGVSSYLGSWLFLLKKEDTDE